MTSLYDTIIPQAFLDLRGLTWYVYIHLQLMSSVNMISSVAKIFELELALAGDNKVFHLVYFSMEKAFFRVEYPKKGNEYKAICEKPKSSFL